MGLIVAVGLIADQTTKALVVAHLAPGRSIPLVGDIFQLSLYRNSGAAFSTGTSLTAVFAVAGLVALAALGIWVVPRVRSAWWVAAVGLGLAGIAGNLVDRFVRSPGVLRGHVIDFLDLKYFAVFNVADIMLTSAAILVLIILFFVKVGFDGRPLADSQTKAA